MPTEHTIEIAIERGDHEIILSIKGIVTLAFGDVPYLKNGDRGEPGDDGEESIDCVEWVSGHWAFRPLLRDESDLTQGEIDMVKTLLFEAAVDDSFDY